MVSCGVGLCDNQYQGIVPVPKSIGNGQDPRNNLYWGAAYGVKTWFARKSSDWEPVGSSRFSHGVVLERLEFRHRITGDRLLADAYDGQYIKDAITDFLRSANGQLDDVDADLVAFVGHDGLMDFSVDVPMVLLVGKPREAVILVCYSRHLPHLMRAQAYHKYQKCGLQGARRLFAGNE